jgi:hypothetical protein
VTPSDYSGPKKPPGFEFQISDSRSWIVDSAIRIPNSAIEMGESEIYRVAFEKGKELTDRALKLAEVGKQKPNWELEGLLKAVCFSFTISARTTISRKKPEEMRRITLPLLSSNVSCFRTYVPSGVSRSE